jgi:Glycosyltransferase family 87
MRFAERLRRRRVLLVQIAAVVVGVMLLRLKWSSPSELVAAIDHGDGLFADFVHHYYPTVEPPLRDAHPAGGFFYPAAFAVLIAPIGWLPLSIAKVVWGTIQIGCVLWAATELVRRVAPDRPLLAVLGAMLTVTSIPILHNLKWGQVSILILAAAAGGFVAHARGRANLAALLLGVAAGIKGYPLIFLGWFAARGDFRFVLRAGIACLFTIVVLPAVVMGPGHALFFQRVSTSAVLGAAEGVLRDFNSQYAPAVLSRYYPGGWNAAPVEALAWARLGSGITLAIVAVLVLIAARSSAPRIAERRQMLGFALITCSLPFWIRTSWSHYFVHLPMAQTLLAAAFSRDGRPREILALGTLVAPSVYLSSVLGLLETRGWWYYANAGSLFFANALVLLGCAAFVVDAHIREGASLMSGAVESGRAWARAALARIERT